MDRLKASAATSDAHVFRSDSLVLQNVWEIQAVHAQMLFQGHFPQVDLTSVNPKLDGNLGLKAHVGIGVEKEAAEQFC